MKFIQPIFILVLLTFLVVIANGQTKAWTYSECLEYALENNLSVKRGALNMERDEVNLRQSKADMYPNLNVGGQFGVNWGRSIDPTTNLFSTQRINSSGISGGSSVTVFSGLMKLNTLKQNRLNLELSAHNLEKTRNDVLLEVMTYYTNVIFNNELLATAKLQLETTTRQLERTEKLVDAGSLAISEVLDLRSQLASNELEVINAENSLDLALLNLKQVMQMPAVEELDVVVPELEEDVGFTALSSTEIYKAAELIQPEIKSADINLESSIYGEKIAKGALYPTLRLGFSLFTNYSDIRDPKTMADGTFGPPGQIPDAGFVTGDPTQSITLLTPNPNFIDVENGVWTQYGDNLSRALSFSLSVPIFNGLTAKSSLQRANVNRAQAEIDAMEVRNQMRQIIEAAYNDAESAAKAFDASQKQVDALEESFRVTEKRYNLGAVNFVDYQVAQNNLFRAKSDLVRTKYDYIFKNKILDFYQGNPIDF